MQLDQHEAKETSAHIEHYIAWRAITSWHKGLNELVDTRHDEQYGSCEGNQPSIDAYTP